MILHILIVLFIPAVWAQLPRVAVQNPDCDSEWAELATGAVQSRVQETRKLRLVRAILESCNKALVQKMTEVSVHLFEKGTFPNGELVGEIKRMATKINEEKRRRLVERGHQVPEHLRYVIDSLADIAVNGSLSGNEKSQRSTMVLSQLHGIERAVIIEALTKSSPPKQENTSLLPTQQIVFPPPKTEDLPGQRLFLPSVSEENQNLGSKFPGFGQPSLFGEEKAGGERNVELNLAVEKRGQGDRLFQTKITELGPSLPSLPEMPFVTSPTLGQLGGSEARGEQGQLPASVGTVSHRGETREVEGERARLGGWGDALAIQPVGGRTEKPNPNADLLEPRPSLWRDAAQFLEKSARVPENVARFIEKALQNPVAALGALKMPPPTPAPTATPPPQPAPASLVSALGAYAPGGGAGGMGGMGPSGFGLSPGLPAPPMGSLGFSGVPAGNSYVPATSANRMDNFHTFSLPSVGKTPMELMQQQWQGSRVGMGGVGMGGAGMGGVGGTPGIGGNGLGAGMGLGEGNGFGSGLSGLGGGGGGVGNGFGAGLGGIGGGAGLGGGSGLGAGLGGLGAGGGAGGGIGLGGTGMGSALQQSQFARLGGLGAASGQYGGSGGGGGAGGMGVQEQLLLAQLGQRGGMPFRHAKSAQTFESQGAETDLVSTGREFLPSKEEVPDLPELPELPALKEDKYEKIVDRPWETARALIPEKSWELDKSGKIPDKPWERVEKGGAAPEISEATLRHLMEAELKFEQDKEHKEKASQYKKPNSLPVYPPVAIDPPQILEPMRPRG